MLKQRVEEAGLLDRRPVYYLATIGVALSMLALIVTVVLVTDHPGPRLLAAVCLAFASMQMGLLGHDAGHNQIFKARGKNRAAGMLLGNLCLGISNSWWIHEHSRHHRYTNQADRDPDIENPVVAFTRRQAVVRRGIRRLVTKYQAMLFVPLLFLEGVSLRVKSVRFLLEAKPSSAPIESLLIAVHFALYFGFVLSRLTGWEAALFVFLHQGLFGLYAGWVFALNHTGRPIFHSDCDMDFLRRQVVASRDIRSHPLLDFVYGGANYQIEHHLFPSMARCRLREAKNIVKEFCREQEIEYHETSVSQGCREVVAYLHEIGRSAGMVTVRGSLWPHGSR